MENDTQDLYKQLDDIVNSIYTIKHKKINFVPGVSNIPVNGRVFDEKEVLNAVNASLDFWLTDGPYAEEFNNKLSNFLGVKFSRLVNSGSSANLVALSSLTSSKLKNNLKPGDEVVTAAVGFPTTVNPIFQNNLTPVFVDCELGTYNPNIEDIISACSDKTKAIFLAHTLGNPFEVLELSKFCKENNIWLIEDNCDALGSTYNNKLTGTFGDISTLSFYPAHHITMGEGGAVLTSSTKLKLQIDSFRDWGRDCWCQSGHDNTCNKRYDWQLGELPYGYDHKFTYSNIGYNLKATDLQASIGLAQLDKLDGFIEKRKSNWKKVNNYISSKKEYFIPHQATPGSEPSWFGYAITVRTDKFSRNDLIQHLNEHRIATRLMFGGNLIRQPAYSNRKFKVHNNLTNADTVMNHSFWIGVYPGITDEMYDYIFEVFENFLN